MMDTSNIHKRLLWILASLVVLLIVWLPYSSLIKLNPLELTNITTVRSEVVALPYLGPGWGPKPFWLEGTRQL